MAQLSLAGCKGGTEFGTEALNAGQEGLVSAAQAFDSIEGQAELILREPTDPFVVTEAAESILGLTSDGKVVIDRTRKQLQRAQVAFSRVEDKENPIAAFVRGIGDFFVRVPLSLAALLGVFLILMIVNRRLGTKRTIEQVVTQHRTALLEKAADPADPTTMREVRAVDRIDPKRNRAHQLAKSLPSLTPSKGTSS